VAVAVREALPPAAGEADDPLVTRWAGLFAELVARGSVNGLVRELAWQAQCVEAQALADQPARYVLRVERESLRQPGHRDRLQAALGDLLGRAVALEVVAGTVTDSAARRDATRRARAQHEAERVITQDPVVTHLLAHYPGSRIVPGSIRPTS
jgi:DNA polymerase-3 subunit gamma/tau